MNGRSPVGSHARGRLTPEDRRRIAHDVLTPLAVIVGVLELFQDGEAGPLTPAQRRLLGSMERSAHRLGGAIGDLLFLLAPRQRSLLLPSTRLGRRKAR